jgi:hypothetical protein
VCPHHAGRRVGRDLAFIHAGTSWSSCCSSPAAVFTLPRRIWDGINEHLDPTMRGRHHHDPLTAVLLVLDLRMRRKRES